MESIGIMLAPMLLSSLMTTVAPVALIMGGDGLTKERIARGFAQLTIVTARAAVDVTYDDLVFDGRSNDFSIRGLRIELPEASGLKDCVVTIDAITIVSLNRPDALAFSTEGDGLSLAPTCLGSEGNMATSLLGPDALNADHFSSTGAYQLGNSTYDMTVLLETVAAGSVALSARLEGLHLSEGENRDPVPRGRITEVEVTFQNTDSLRRLIPMLGVGDDPAGMAVGQLEALLGSDGLSPDDTVLIDSAKIELARLVRDGGAITLRTGPGAAATFEALEATNGPEEVVPLLKPRFSSALVASDVLVSADMLKAAFSESGDLSTDERLEVARALASGIGAPRSVSMASALLGPMAAEGDGEAALEYARLLHEESDDVGAAYRFALAAGAAGAKGARSVLDRIESDLPMETILDLQAAAVEGSAPVATEPDVARLRGLARDYANGRGVVRNYREAMFNALLASAAGDRASKILLERLDSRFDDEDSEDAWHVLETEQSERALELWASGFGDDFAAK